MKKSLLNLGRELTKKEQKNVYGGYGGGASGGGGDGGSGDGSGDGSGGGGALHCYCGSGGVYKTGHCKWCGWFCGASGVIKCE